MSPEPFVVCLTNTVAANFTANLLLAAGAKPAMVEEPVEAAEIAAVADAVLVNVGTVTRTQAETMRAAIAACRERAVPWVLDPVACQALAFRRGLVLEFLRAAPALVRGNAAEIACLEGLVPDLHETTTVLATGEVDVIGGCERITGGVEMLQRVTATGCAQGALAAAFLGRGMSPREAARAASRLLKRAGEAAWRQTQTPGSFQIALIDAVAVEARTGL